MLVQFGFLQKKLCTELHHKRTACVKLNHWVSFVIPSRANCVRSYFILVYLYCRQMCYILGQLSSLKEPSLYIFEREELWSLNGSWGLSGGHHRSSIGAQTCNPDQPADMTTSWPGGLAGAVGGRGEMTQKTAGQARTDLEPDNGSINQLPWAVSSRAQITSSCRATVSQLPSSQTITFWTITLVLPWSGCILGVTSLRNALLPVLAFNGE